MAEQPKTPNGWVDEQWDGSAAQWDTAAGYCGACLIDLNAEGADKVKDLCLLPYKNQDGNTNVRGVMACAGGRGITRVQKPDGVSADAWSSAKRKAAQKLVSLYRRMGRIAPETIYRMAGEKMPAS